MWYFTIRFLGCLFILIILLLVIKKSAVKRKKILSIVLAVSCTLSFGLLTLFPLENYFVSFNSPEAAFNYCYSGEIQDIVEGDSSIMIIYSSNNNTTSFAFMPKDLTGYKIQISFSYDKIYNKLMERGDISIYKVKNTKDHYFVRGAISSVDTENISDSCDSYFRSIIKKIPNSTNSNILTYAFIESFDDNYFYFLNNEKIYIK